MHMLETVRVRTLQGDLRPVGLFIPFPRAWKAVKEFMETDGQLPKSIEWITRSTIRTKKW